MNLSAGLLPTGSRRQVFMAWPIRPASPGGSASCSGSGTRARPRVLRFTIPAGSSRAMTILGVPEGMQRRVALGDGEQAHYHWGGHMLSRQSRSQATPTRAPPCTDKHSDHGETAAAASCAIWVLPASGVTSDNLFVTLAPAALPRAPYRTRRPMEPGVKVYSLRSSSRTCASPRHPLTWVRQPSGAFASNTAGGAITPASLCPARAALFNRIKAPRVRQAVRRQCPCLSGHALEQPQNSGPCCSLKRAARTTPDFAVSRARNARCSSPSGKAR